MSKNRWIISPFLAFAGAALGLAIGATVHNEPAIVVIAALMVGVNVVTVRMLLQ